MEIAKGMFGILQKQIQATDWRHNGDTLSSYIGWGVLTSGSTTLKRFNLFLWSKSCHQGGLYKWFKHKKRQIRTRLLKQLQLNHWQVKDEKGHGVELPLYTKVESQTQLLNGKTA